jgi:hypothetical protein
MMSEKISKRLIALKSQFEKWDDWDFGKRDRELFFTLNRENDYVPGIYNIFVKSYYIILNKIFRGHDIDCQFSHITLMKIFDLAIKYADNIAFQ